MKREIKLSKYEVVARACSIVEKEDYEIETSFVSAVDIKNSKCIKMTTGDFGMAAYNELGYGFMISWDIFEKLQKELEITEEKYEEFLDDFLNNFTDTVIEFVDSFQSRF